MTRVEISLTARDQLTNLSEDVQERIKTKLLDEVSDDPERYLRPLSNSPHRSIRVGDYRVIANYDEEEDRLKSTIWDTAATSTIDNRCISPFLCR